MSVSNAGTGLFTFHLESYLEPLGAYIQYPPHHPGAHPDEPLSEVAE